MDLPTLVEIEQAAARLRDVAVVTPVATSAELEARVGARVFLKCEQKQRTGSFKFRGAFNAVASLPPDINGKPAVTVSSGNHGQALALAARLHDRAAIIYAPGSITPTKRQAILAQGGTMVDCATRAEAEAVAAGRAQSGEVVLVHPFDDARVIAGQGTCAFEFLAQVGAVDVLLAPVGGGGLLSGTCLAAHARRPGVQIYACEPTGALDAIESVRSGRIVPMLNPRTMADGLRSSLGVLTLAILRRHLAGFFTVEEEDIVQALAFADTQLGLVIEPSSAVALAPLLRGEPLLQGRRVGVILTGGNVEGARPKAGGAHVGG